MIQAGHRSKLSGLGFAGWPAYNWRTDTRKERGSVEISDIRAGFAGKSSRRIEVDILTEDFDAALKLFEEKDVEPDEGFRIALFAGLAELKRQSTMSEEDEESLVKQLNRLDSAYVGMKNKAYRLALDNERMELARNGWIVELGAAQDLVRQLRARIAELEGKPMRPTPEAAKAVQQELELEAPANAPEAHQSPPQAANQDDTGRSLWRRITGG